MFYRKAIAAACYAVVVLGLGLIAAQPAQAYRIKKICEEVTTKTGTVEKCRWVLDTESVEQPAKSDKVKDAKKANSGTTK
jgi:hypothetical protein